VAEVLLALGMISLIWRRFPGIRSLKAVLALAMVSYIAVPIYFTLMISGP
jgi:hypothetical protein